MTQTPDKSRKKPGRKPGYGKGSEVTQVSVIIRNNQVDFWDALPNKSAFVQNAIDEAIKKEQEASHYSPSIPPGTYSIQVTEKDGLYKKIELDPL